MYKTFLAILAIVWVVDVLNIDFIINGIHIVEFLDVTVPINGLFWFLVWAFVPSSKVMYIKED